MECILKDTSLQKTLLFDNHGQISLETEAPLSVGRALDTMMRAVSHWDVERQSPMKGKLMSIVNVQRTT